MEEKEKGLVVNLTESFSIKLARYLLDLRETGVKKTKAQILVELAEEALLKRTTQKEIK
jgi:hypothetical protein